MRSAAPEDVSGRSLKVPGSYYMDSNERGSPTSQPYLGKPVSILHNTECACMATRQRSHLGGLRIAL